MSIWKDFITIVEEETLSLLQHWLPPIANMGIFHDLITYFSQFLELKVAYNIKMPSKHETLR